jgi:hypothetical protein
MNEMLRGSGWPKLTIVKMSLDKIAILSSVLLTTFLLPIGVSCGIYLLVFWRRNKVVPKTVRVSSINDVTQFFAILIIPLPLLT